MIIRDIEWQTDMKGKVLQREEQKKQWEEEKKKK